MEKIGKLDNVEEGWNTWKSVFMQICDKHVPFVTLRVRGVKAPWVTTEFVNLSRERDEPRERAEDSQDKEEWKHFRTCRNYVNNLRNT